VADPRRFQEEAVRALKRIGRPAVEPLVAALRNDRGILHLRFAEALSEIDDPRAADALMVGLRQARLPVVAGAFRFFIRQGEPGSEAVLIRALEFTDDAMMAHDFSMCGNGVLEQAAKDWNQRHNVGFVLQVGRVVPRWGEKKP
jgi:hypothetical protein